MASICLGKATCQKWTARLHVRSVRACVHALSPSKQRLIPGGRQSGLMVTTALFWQSNSATVFKSLRGQVYPNTVRNKQDILEIFRLVTSVKFLRREGGSIDGKKKTRSCHSPPRIDHPSIIYASYSAYLAKPRPKTSTDTTRKTRKVFFPISFSQTPISNTHYVSRQIDSMM